MKLVTRQLQKFAALSLIAAFQFAAASRTCAATLTFDEISGELVANGYGGLNWNYFGVLCGRCLSTNYGYHAGTISAPNVAFNIYGEPATISSTNTFDLNSAYLTSSMNIDNPVQVRVQGWVGAVLTYTNTYVVNRHTPMLVNFNYLGVNRVTFTTVPAVQFAMDDVSVTVPGRPLSNAPPPVALGPVVVTNIGHVFQTNMLSPPGMPAMTNHAVAFIIDQSQQTGGTALPPVNVNWDTNSEFALTLSAPVGKKFLVEVPAGQSVMFHGSLLWESSRGGTAPVGPVSVSFANLEGTAPDFAGSDAVLSDSHGFFGFYEVISSETTNSFAFTSMTLLGSVLPQYTGNGAEDYIAHNASSLRLIYSGGETSDPGPLVSIIPTNPPAAIGLQALTPDGAILRLRGQIGRTVSVECSEDLIHWTAISTNTMPCSLLDAGVNNASRRFYRTRVLP